MLKKQVSGILTNAAAKFLLPTTRICLKCCHINSSLPLPNLDAYFSVHFSDLFIAVSLSLNLFMKQLKFSSPILGSAPRMTDLEPEKKF